MKVITLINILIHPSKIPTINKRYCRSRIRSTDQPYNSRQSKHRIFYFLFVTYENKNPTQVPLLRNMSTLNNFFVYWKHVTYARPLFTEGKIQSFWFCVLYTIAFCLSDYANLRLLVFSPKEPLLAFYRILFPICNFYQINRIRSIFYFNQNFSINLK